MDNINADLNRFIQKQVTKLWHSTAALAKLRRGIGKELGDVPILLEYVLPFELASILILAGIVGAVLIGKKDL